MVLYVMAFKHFAVHEPPNVTATLPCEKEMSALEAGEIQPMAKVGLVKAWAPILRIE
jgi:hypothetical protein